jgi:hypothetical protein
MSFSGVNAIVLVYVAPLTRMAVAETLCMTRLLTDSLENFTGASLTIGAEL